MLLVLMASLGQPNALHLVVPYLSVVLAATLVAVLACLLCVNDFRVSVDVVKIELGLPLAVFFVLAAFSLFRAPEPLFGLGLLASALIKVVMFYALMLAARRASVSEVVAKTVVAVSVVFSLSGIVLFVAIVAFGLEPLREFGASNIGGGLEYDQQLRFYGLGFVRSQTSLLELAFPRLQSYFSEPGYFGFFLELALFCNLYLRHVLEPVPTRRLRINAALLVQITALALTLSLAAIVAIAVGLAAYAIGSGRVSQALRLASKAAVTLTLATLGLAAWLRIENPFDLLYSILVTERFETDYGSNSADTRLSAFRLGLGLVEQKPLGGWGFGQVRVALDGLGVNNSFLTAFAEMGLPGFLAYVSMVLVAMIVAWRCLRPARFVSRREYDAAAALMAMFLSMTLHTLLLDTSWSFIYWLAIALLFLHRARLRAMLRVTSTSAA